jgi:CHASE3 domain sensor protein
LLKSFFSARLEIMRQMVEATSAGRPDTAAALVRSKAGRRETTHIQEQIDVLMAEEQRLLTQRMSALAQHESDARLALLALAGLGVAFLILPGSSIDKRYVTFGSRRRRPTLGVRTFSPHCAVVVTV